MPEWLTALTVIISTLLGASGGWLVSRSAAKKNKVDSETQIAAAYDNLCKTLRAEIEALRLNTLEDRKQIKELREQICNLEDALATSERERSLQDEQIKIQDKQIKSQEQQIKNLSKRLAKYEKTNEPDAVIA